MTINNSGGRPGKPCAEPGCWRLRPCAEHPGRDLHRWDVRRTERHAPLSEAARRAVLERDGWTCRACGRPTRTVDHVIAVALGGTNDMTNLQALCGACNTAKAAREAHESRRRRDGGA